MDDSPELEQRQTVVRFSLRGLFLTSIFFGLAFAFSKFCLANQNTTRFYSIVIGVSSGITLSIFLNSIFRLRAERKAGRPILKTAGSKHYVLWMLTLMTSTFFVIVSLLIFTPRNILAEWVVLLIYTTILGLPIGILVLNRWWHNVYSSIEFCELGVIMKGVSFYAWDHITVQRWNPTDGKLVLQTRKTWSWGFIIIPDDRERVDAILSQYIQKREEVE